MASVVAMMVGGAVLNATTFVGVGSNDAVYFKSKDGKEMVQVFDKSMSNKYYFHEEIKKALTQSLIFRSFLRS